MKILKDKENKIKIKEAIAKEFTDNWQTNRLSNIRRVVVNDIEKSLILGKILDLLNKIYLLLIQNQKNNFKKDD